ncbi:MAG TPA: DNA mismatch repair protein MutS [Candidatus Binatia bacterium]|jgi:DNA mismatch repair protein MutS|nr:DNA mismatch repair protein MutS [Candidatus Binatia bacterium]
MEQYHQAKAQYQDALLFFRLGDFYEMFYDDAAIGARELDIVLTSRPQGKGRERVPLCGVPHHRLESYLARLVEKGYKVAICEQIEESQKGRKILTRDVVRVVTPGTLFETGGKEQVLAALFPEKDHLGVAFLALTTGEFLVAETTPADLPGLFGKLQPKEVVLKAGEQFDTNGHTDVFVTERPREEFIAETALGHLRQSFGQEAVDALALTNRRSLIAAGVLLGYVKETQQAFLPHLKAPQPYRSEDFVFLDPQTQRNLELVENILEGREEGTLFSLLNITATRMGRRRLRNWLLHPLLAVEKISQRQAAVAELVACHSLRAELRTLLSRILDLERLTSRITSAIANPRDLAALQASLAPLPRLHELLSSSTATFLRTLHDAFDPLDDIHREIQRVLVEEPRALAKEGGIIRAGVSAELDELRMIQTDGSSWLANLEQQEREQTGIANLRVGFNKVFGYYLEVTKSYLHLVPKSYTRRQTLVNAERFQTKELQRFEEKVLSAADRSRALEYNIFTSLREQVAAQANRLRQTAGVLGTLDVLCALAEVAVKKGWARPEVSEEYGLHITEGRHPVVEALTGSFVPNDLCLDEHHHLLLLTGPNAAGKSTYARQAALLVLLAQIGSFLPAETATIGVVDRIFTRVGAADFLARGLSTFMVEMMETANILRYATARSLVILDEVGRGTGTSDGQAIAQAVAEILAQEIKAKTLFTTHYHELARLAETTPGIVNARLAVREEQDEVTFLYKVVPGAAQKSYGVYVARLAGLPESVVERAKKLLTGWQQEKEDFALSATTQTMKRNGLMPAEREKENTLRTAPAVMEHLSGIDPLHTTPMEALALLAELKNLAEGRGK